MTLCDETRALMSAYLDGEIDAAGQMDFEEHIEGCEECSAMLVELSDLVSMLRMIPEVRTPDDFHEAAMHKLRDNLNPVDFFTPGVKKDNEKKKDKKEKKKEKSVVNRKISWRRVCLAGGALIASMFIISIFGSRIDESLPEGSAMLAVGNQTTMFTFEEWDLTPESNEAEVMPEAMVAGFNSASYGTKDMDSGTGMTDALITDDIFIKQYNIVITVEDFDSALALIDSLPGVNAGMSVDYGYSQSANITRHIPQADYMSSKEFLRRLGGIKNESESESRISGELINLESRLKAKEEEINRLLAILEKSASLNYMTTVERRISEATRERDNLKTQIIQYNTQASSCVLNIVVNYTEPAATWQPQKYFDKLRNSFEKSLEFCRRAFENIAVFISVTLVPVIVIVIIITLVIFIIRGRSRRNEK